MNVVLTCYAKKGKGSFTIEREGKTVYKDVFNINKVGVTLKEYIFEVITKGLKVARTFINHDDLLLICLQNGHMVEWLNGSKDYKDYSKYLDVVYDIIDTLDCKYLFTLSNVKKAKDIIGCDVVKDELTGVSSLLDM